MTNFTEEMAQKAKNAKTVEELLKIAADEGVMLTQQQGEAYFAQLNPASGEISDDELDNVSGGACGSDQDTFSDGNHVKVRAGLGFMSCGVCRGTKGIYHCNSTKWWVDCSEKGCTGRVASMSFDSGHPAGYLDRI